MDSPTRRRFLSGIGLAASYAAIGSVDATDTLAPTAGTWRQFGNGPTNTFHSGTATPPRAEPSRPWTYGDAGGIAPWASIAVVGETAYVPFSYDRGSAGLHAVDVTTGERRWRYPIEANTSAPAVVDGIAYVGTARGSVHAVDVESGERVWRRPGLSYMTPTATVAGGTVYVPTTKSDDGALVALDAADGSEVWRYPAEQGVSRYAPAVADGAVYAVTYDGTAHAVDAGTGDRRWTYAEAGDDVTPAVGGGGRLYVSNPSQGIDALDPADGTRIWRQADRELFSMPAYADESLFVVHSGTLFVLDAATGSFTWSASIGSSGSDVPVVTDEMIYLEVYIRSGSGQTFTGVDRTAREVRWQFDLGSSATAPTVAGDTAYLGTEDGQFVALTGEGGATTTSTPTTTAGGGKSPTDRSDDSDDEPPGGDDSMDNGGDEAGDDSGDDSGASTPGFGALAAIAAIGGGAYRAVRNRD